MLINMEKSTSLLIFGFIFVMIHVISASTEFKEIKYRRQATSFGLRKISDSSNYQGKVAVRSGINVERVKRGEEDAIAAAAEPEPPGVTETVTEAPAESGIDEPVVPVDDTTSTVTDPKTETSLGVESITNTIAAEPNVLGKEGNVTKNPLQRELESAIQAGTAKINTTTLPQGGLSVGSPIDIKKDIENVVLSNVKLGVDVVKTVKNAVTHRIGSITSKVQEQEENVRRVGHTVRENVLGIGLNVTQGLTKAIGFGGIVPGILDIVKE